MESVVPDEITHELTQILSNLVLGDNEIRSNQRPLTVFTRCVHFLSSSSVDFSSVHLHPPPPHPHPRPTNPLAHSHSTTSSPPKPSPHSNVSSFTLS
ncbi:hypothetical protein H0H93_001961 [Arthromyces matolae]|nr:hypothetical protein H0H93_001961 [Arthromyces matolae]